MQLYQEGPVRCHTGTRYRGCGLDLAPEVACRGCIYTSARIELDISHPTPQKQKVRWERYKQTRPVLLF